MDKKVLYETTMDPKKRRLLRVVIPDGDAVATDQVISDLMGKDAAPRYHAIMEAGPEIDDIDA